MKILITGVSGQLGRCLVERLENEHQIIAVTDPAGSQQTGDSRCDSQRNCAGSDHQSGSVQQWTKPNLNRNWQRQ
jgi:dTDP-4-dehydrorhamnose reductase